MRLHREVFVFGYFFVFLSTLSTNVFANFCFDGKCEKYYLDTDGGDNPQSPGCLSVSNQSDCSIKSVIVYDYCGEDNKLTEVVGNAQCSKTAEYQIFEYDCDVWCKAQYGEYIEGYCVSEQVAACNNQTIGYCGCYNR